MPRAQELYAYCFCDPCVAFSPEGRFLTQADCRRHKLQQQTPKSARPVEPAHPVEPARPVEKPAASQVEKLANSVLRMTLQAVPAVTSPAASNVNVHVVPEKTSITDDCDVSLLEKAFERISLEDSPTPNKLRVSGKKERARRASTERALKILHAIAAELATLEVCLSANGDALSFSVITQIESRMIDMDIALSRMKPTEGDEVPKLRSAVEATLEVHRSRCQYLRTSISTLVGEESPVNFSSGR